jgi:hypothetical protein
MNVDRVCTGYYPSIEIGQGDEGAKRTILNIDHNETPSYIPSLFLQGQASLPASSLFNGTPALMWTPEALTHLLQADIQNHFELRIQLFFQQLLLSYRSQLVFKKYQTQLQVGMQVKTNSCDLVEAHCSTLPSLSFVTKGDKDHYFMCEESEGVSIQPRVYAAFSSFHKSWNTTTRLPRFVNEVDSLIDEHAKRDFLLGDHFRNFCIDIHCYNAEGRIEPQQGLKKFLYAINRLLDDLLQSSQEIWTTRVLRDYKQVADSYYRQAKNSDALFHKLSFGVNMPHCEERYGCLQQRLSQKALSESLLWRQIQEIEKQAFTLIGSNLIHHKNDLVKCVLIQMCYQSSRREGIRALIIEGNYKPGSTAYGYVHQLIASPEISSLCINYLSQRSIAQITHDLSHNSQEIQNIEVAMRRALQKSVKHVRWIVRAVLEKACDFIEEPSSEALVSVQKFLCLNHSWARSHLYYSQFSKYVNSCLENGEFLRSCRHLISQILENRNW